MVVDRGDLSRQILLIIILTELEGPTVTTEKEAVAVVFMICCG